MEKVDVRKLLREMVVRLRKRSGMCRVPPSVSLRGSD
jgi:hypothetical protein